MKLLKHIIKPLATAGVFSAMLLTSCNKNFFEIEDPNGIEDEVMWESEGAVGLYLNRAYAMIIPKWPTVGGIHNSSDETNNINADFMYGRLTENSVTDIGTSSGLTANRYADIRRCNTGIEGINSSKTLPQASRNLLKSQFYFLRAYAYFNLVRLYGGVPLVLKAQGQADDDLQVARSKTSECVAQIAADCDSAAAYLPAKWTGNDVGRATRAAALAVKAKILLYWASPQFNIGNVSSRWEAAYTASKAAYTACVNDGYSLIPSYGNLFIQEDNSEILLVRKYTNTKDLGVNTEQITRPFSETVSGGGSNQPTWNLVKAYTMSNGLPITDSRSKYDTVIFWQNRDPRFKATISYNGDVWPLSGKAGRIQYSYKGVAEESPSTIVTGFYCKRLCNPSISAAQAAYNSNSGGGSGMDWIEMRFAEVILNLAECANETGKLAEAKDMVRLIRKRAGIVNEADYDYGLSIATDVISMRKLLLNERQIEFAFEGMRYHDLRRTRNLGIMTNRESLIPTPISPYVGGTGTDATKIYLDRVYPSGVKPRDTLNLQNPDTYRRVLQLAPASLEGADAISMPDKYYVYPLPTTFTRTPIIQQTNGWSGGTFDPFQ
ncbi:RagB/SusD family nutrient uptake outer membrane protein [Chitinophaga sp. sic0106]|uniref:RagB/SusD family nutrient uptake outer membrane protein n=1 Tax=Chitinophaga sp. sic0106 TaxID=2854785 RepID=UPI001C462479|nr:RagB/SusD family nutrient uptake outer membrane protein [Chitinophaga sp. sic0106]MBV7530198.1 RagB/SusD family nutrient uptake outer membrane protein [Chitinophaga sp. sic0106]